MGFVGIIVVLAVLYWASFDRKSIDYKSIIYLFITEVVLLFLMLKTSLGNWILQGLSGSLNIITVSSSKGVNFVFGDLTNPGATSQFFLNVLLPLIFICAIIELLQYLRILPFIIKYVGKVLKKLFHIDEINAFTILSYPFVSNGVFVPFKDQMQTMSPNQLFTLAMYTMSNTTVTMIASYMHIIKSEYIIVALVLNLFSSIIVAKIVAPYDISEVHYEISTKSTNKKSLITRLMDSMNLGFKLAINISISIIGFVSLITFINIIFKSICGKTLTSIVGYICAPIAFLMGIDVHSIVSAGTVLATKAFTNIFVAINEINMHAVSLKTQAIVSVFLISFANLPNLGTTLGIMHTMVDEEHGEAIAKHALRLFLVATSVSIINGSLAGLFYSF
ncbi:nucleoside transporter C-terminal domain-containing protein [Lactobacillus sp. ESL0791]|uniref:nucleoside transporter C-terminal domain-containing protein n=1 Tax=Lactobacillus sp. ESL0791 TaxID=2983234 RepID=UPI0023F6480F|nr:nucleoside transporter C-terminal domain-containing protein [Lactobacillus sp. ESL0791]MDF7639046.1 nucleoside transporter C-terminal domain-containing protein [Lactobacillus sp. ESL0791]